MGGGPGRDGLNRDGPDHRHQEENQGIHNLLRPPFQMENEQQPSTEPTRDPPRGLLPTPTAAPQEQEEQPQPSTASTSETTNKPAEDNNEENEEGGNKKRKKKKKKKKNNLMAFSMF